MKNPNCPCVYMLTNWNKTVLYTGVTGNLSERLAWHMAPTKSSFTTKYNVRYLVYFEYLNSMSCAIEREKQIKGWSRAKKDKLISDFNPNWVFISHSPPHHFNSERSEESVTIITNNGHADDQREEAP